jgi:pyrroloquinoline quinone biosynthesis protein B
VPQWNCSCPNCQGARQGLVAVRTQSCVALADHQGKWYLVNASSDLSVQLQQFPELHPYTQPLRNSPIAGVLLTNADLDHLLGLFSLREGHSLDVYASTATRRIAESSLGLETVLNTFCGSRWSEPPTKDFAPLCADSETDEGLLFRAIELPGKPPPFARNAEPGAHSLAYQFLDPRTGGRLLVAPDVAEVSPALHEALSNSDAVLFDGTFWSSDELVKVRPGARPAADMGHVTIRDCSLELLKKSTSSNKVYIHINNTNPILSPHSAERAAVEAAGIVVGWDGMEFEL